jgi:hypothetical protein
VQGDLATVAPSCTCGRHTATLSGITGRSVSVFTRPGGESKVVTKLPDLARELLQSVHLQLAQIGPSTFEVRYQPLDGGGLADEAAAAEAIRSSLWSDSEIVFLRRAMSPGATDKMIDFVNEWDPDLLGTT